MFPPSAWDAHLLASSELETGVLRFNRELQTKRQSVLCAHQEYKHCPSYSLPLCAMNVHRMGKEDKGKKWKRESPNIKCREEENGRHHEYENQNPNETSKYLPAGRYVKIHFDCTGP